MMTEVFWTFFITSVFGFCIGVSRMLYKSKCKEVACCGMKIIRDVELEEKEMEFATIHRTTRQNSSIEEEEKI